MIAVDPTFMIEEGYDREEHYCSAIVELEEGLCINGFIAGIDASKPNQLKISVPLEAEFLEVARDDSTGLPASFRPVKPRLEQGENHGTNAVETLCSANR